MSFSHTQLSREIVDDLSDCSEQTNRSSASPERLAITSRDQEEEPGGLSTESDHTSSDKEPENRTATHVRHQHKKKKGEKPMPCHCPHCPDRVFARPCQLAMHMKTHTALVNLPNQAQSGTDEIMDAKMKSHKVLHFMFSSARNSVCRYEYIEIFFSSHISHIKDANKYERKMNQPLKKPSIKHYSEYLR